MLPLLTSQLLTQLTDLLSNAHQKETLTVTLIFMTQEGTRDQGWEWMKL